MTLPRAARSLAAKHPYGALFVLALLVRVLVVLVVGLLLPQLSFFDDGTYSQLAQERVSGESRLWDAYASWLYVRTGALLFPLTLLYQVFGPSELVGPLLVAVFGAGVAAVTARLVTLVLDVRAGIIAGCLVAVLPSQVLISSVLAKDALNWFFLSALALVVASAANTASRRRLTWLVATAAGLLALIGMVRLHTMTVAAVALVLVAFFGTRETRAPRGFGMALVAIAVPWAIGIGPLGAQLVANHGSLEGTRAYHASGGSAVEELRPPPVEQAQSAAAAKPPAAPGVEAPDPQAVTVQPGESGDEVTRNLAYLPRGITVILFEPVPWRSGGSTALRLASFEAVVWYPVLALALVGAVTASRRRDLLAFPLVAGGALVCMWALVDGNIGTAFRHRGEVVWAVVVLAAHGASVLWGRRTRQPYHDDPATEPALIREPESVKAR